MQTSILHYKGQEMPRTHVLKTCQNAGMHRSVCASRSKRFTQHSHNRPGANLRSVQGLLISGPEQAVDYHGLKEALLLTQESVS